MDRIILSRISVDCIVGTLPHEREKPQQILLDLELACDLARAGASDNLSHAPDYARAAMLARAFCIDRKALLLEALAEGIATRLLAEFQAVEAVTVRVTKPAAIQDAAGATVEIQRIRPQASNTKKPSTK